MILGLNGIIAGKGTPPSSLLTNLVSVYKAESNANDSFGTNNGTSQGGLTYTTGKSGNAFQFNNTNAYVQLPDNSLNSLTGSFSVSAWFKTASIITSSSNYILWNVSANAWFNNPNGFSINQYGNTFEFIIFNNTNTYTQLTPVYTFSTNTWYNLVCTKQLNGNMRMYLNGSLLASYATTVNPTYLATISKPCIGALNIPARVPSVGSYAQNGFLVDELAIWNKELTSSEVTELQTKYYPF